MKIVKGDLLQLAREGNFEVIVQGSNCFNTMGGGIARQIKAEFPNAYAADCKTVAGDYNKLGNYTLSVETTDAGHPFTIINAYTQYDFNKANSMFGDCFEYNSFALILQKLFHFYPSSHFGFPLIGMGLAGGNEETIMEMLQEFSNTVEAHGGSVTIVEFNKP